MTEFGREYGDGLYALCAEEKIAQDVLIQLQTLKDAFRQNPDFIRLLSNMSLSKQERLSIVDHALRGQVHPYVLNFLKLLVERGAMHAFADCLAAYQEGYNADHQVIEAEVTTAQALSDDQRAKLMKKLSGMTGKDVVLKEKVDSSVLGGVLLQMDGKRYDNTVRSRLKNIQQTMAGE
ncbi:MAG: ATP synthase F1 subunit delta [Clostridia bacterium]|nr:ATP synthase F1 subunit delta [Clostridia bacterium]